MPVYLEHKAEIVWHSKTAVGSDAIVNDVNLYKIYDAGPKYLGGGNVPSAK